MAKSKTAQASMRAGQKKGAYLPSTLIPRLVPLDRGNGVRLRHPGNGQTLSLRTNSAEFVAAIKDAATAGFGDSLREEIVQFVGAYPGNGWEETLQRLDKAGAFSAFVADEAAA